MNAPAGIFDLPARDLPPREILDLGGLWRIRFDPADQGLAEGWHAQPLPPGASRHVAVPSSYNDLYADAAARDHVGPVWYERTFHPPVSWQGRRVFLRFDSVCHRAKVWVNGEPVAEHHGGYLPFGGETTGLARPGATARLTVRVDNRLDWTTLPPGEVEETRLADGAIVRTQKSFHDFFNYAGIDRPVRLFSTGPCVLAGVRADAVLVQDRWAVRCSGRLDGPGTLSWALHDPEGRMVAQASGENCDLPVDAPRLWSPAEPVLYRLVIRAASRSGAPSDAAALNLGLRTLHAGPHGLEINGEPFHFRGFGKHEDFHIIGKGLNLPLLVRDFDLLRWIGANSVRTTHYPYSEEFLDLADEVGLAVIAEAPAVGQCLGFGEKAEVTFCDGKVDGRALARHLDVMERMIARDRHHPCVVVWSVGNEPSTQDPDARPYFEEVFAHTRALDSSRPVMLVEHQPPGLSHTAQLSDIIGVNRYMGWYSEPGQLALAGERLRADLVEWHRRFGKPVFVTEYGADALAGLHALPAQMFSEEYHEDMLALYHRIFDELPFVCGEHVWNFADFATKQGITRVAGNRKGVFTRDRQPKSAARLLRERWRHEDREPLCRTNDQPPP